jgi:hypothetical protein
MKIYSKLLRKNQARIKKTIGILTLGVGIRYGSINSSPINLPSNSTQQIERVNTFVKEHIQDGKVQEGLSHKSSSRLIRTGSGVLIGNKRISEGSKFAVEIRSGELGKGGPGPRAKADARRPSKFGPGSKARGAAKRDFARRQTSNKLTSGRSSGSLFAESFSPKPLYGSRPMPQPGHFNIPKPPSVRCSAKLDDMGFTGYLKPGESKSMEELS